MKVAIGSDHGGVDLKTNLIKHLNNAGYEVVDVGCNSHDSVNYAPYAERVCRKVLSEECKLGILVCGTGIGMSISANKIKGIRAACCSDYFSAKYTRLHNDANVLCIGARVIGYGLASEIVDVFLETEYEGGRHQKRLDEISRLENGESLIVTAD